MTDDERRAAYHEARSALLNLSTTLHNDDELRSARYVADLADWLRQRVPHEYAGYVRLTNERTGVSA
jgi:hypothetical protein